MNRLSKHRAQIACAVILTAAFGWAAVVAFQSGIDNTAAEKQYRQALGELENSDPMPSDLKNFQIRPQMLATLPPPAPLTEITTAPTAFFPHLGTPVVPPQSAPLLPPELPIVVLPAYLMPGTLKVYAQGTGNVLLVILPGDRSMMSVVGFVIQRRAAASAQPGAQLTAGEWVNLPPVWTESGLQPAPTGVASPKPEPAHGLNAVLPGVEVDTPSAPFYLAPYRGIHVLFDPTDRMAVAGTDSRCEYRLVMIGRPAAEAVDKTATASDGRAVQLKIRVPERLARPWRLADVALQVFAPGPAVAPTAAAAVRVKFVTADTASDSGCFQVLRGQAVSAMVTVARGAEIVADLPVLDAAGRPVPGPDGNRRETAATGLVFTRVETDSATRKRSAVLTDVAQAVVRIEQGRIGGGTSAPDIDLALLHQIQTARETACGQRFSATPDADAAAIPVPTQEFAVAASAAMSILQPNSYYPTLVDDATPITPLPPLTVASENARGIRPPPLGLPAQPGQSPVNGDAPGSRSPPPQPRIPLPPPPPPPPEPVLPPVDGGQGIGGRDDPHEHRTMPDFDRDGDNNPPPKADAVYE